MDTAEVRVAPEHTIRRPHGRLWKRETFDTRVKTETDVARTQARAALVGKTRKEKPASPSPLARDTPSQAPVPNAFALSLSLFLSLECESESERERERVGARCGGEAGALGDGARPASHFAYAERQNWESLLNFERVV